MAEKIQSIRGMHDILPEESARWQWFETTVRETVQSYGYSEIRMPVLEMTDLFCRSIGEVTDIVEKEMYTFADRNGDSLTLRPEGTASCVRAAMQHGLLHNQQQRLWYMGPMFRHERPQKGRYRQFHQVGIESFGMSGADIEAEHLLMTARLWKNLGLDDIELQINTLGSNAARTAYKTQLVDYLTKYETSLDEDSQRRLHTNPLRILDSKNPHMQSIIEAAPRLMDHLDDESHRHFEQLKKLLETAGISYVVNTRLVRGLDYYCKTVYEWVTDTLGAQGTVCAGGRYDGLVSQLGGRETPAAGFAMGIERLLSMLEDRLVDVQHRADIYIAMQGEAAELQGLVVAEQIHERYPSLQVQTNCGGGSFKSQLKKADKSQAAVALIIGEQEAADNNIIIKPLRKDTEQIQLQRDECMVQLPDLLEKLG